MDQLEVVDADHDVLDTTAVDHALVNEVNLLVDLLDVSIVALGTAIPEKLRDASLA